jgi:hypothetical protein
MLTAFRIVFPAPLTADTARGWGSAVVGAGVAGGRKVVEGARRPLLGVPFADLVGVAIPPVLFLVFTTGRAGRATVGGPFDGRDGRGSVVAIMLLFCDSRRRERSA